MTFDVRAQLLLDNSNWERKLTQASKQTASFGKSMKTVSNGIKAAWAGVALVGINLVGDAIVELTKKAAEDNKSMALLEEQMRRTWGKKANVQDIEAQIEAMSNATGIVDDKLRPALIRIAAVTRNPAKGMKMLSLATDIAAKSGQDLNLVSRNVAKYLGGNKTALDKLVPGLAKSGDRMAFLTKNYTGFAKIAGDNDPFAKITNTMENFQERLGQSFLPLIQKFSDWLVSEEAQKALGEITKEVEKFGKWFTSPEGQDAFKGWMTDLQALIRLAADFLGLVGDIAALFDFEARDKKTRKALEPSRQASKEFYNTTPLAQQNQILGRTGNMSNAGTVVINVNAPYVSGPAVVDALRQTARRQGLPLKLLIDRG